MNRCHDGAVFLDGSNCRSASSAFASGWARTRSSCRSTPSVSAIPPTSLSEGLRRPLSMKAMWLASTPISGRVHVGSSPKLPGEFLTILRVYSYLSCVVFIQQRSPQLRVMDERGERLEFLRSVDQFKADAVTIHNVLYHFGKDHVWQAYAHGVAFCVFE
jgi:hypothetical protein